MKKKLIGIYPLGSNMCKLFARSDWLDEGHTIAPDKNPGGGGDCNPYAEMTVGIDSNNWQSVLSTLFHEAFEFSAAIAHHSYEYVGGYHFSTQDRLLVMNHQEFEEITEQTGYFIALAIGPLRKAWKAHHRKKKTEKKT